MGRESATPEKSLLMEMTYGHQALRSLPPQFGIAVGNGHSSNILAAGYSGSECDDNTFDFK